MEENESRSIGNIQNYYGSLLVKKSNGKLYFAIEDWNSIDWEEISESLFNELLKHNKKEEGMVFNLDITSVRYGLSQATDSLNGLSSNVSKISKKDDKITVEIKNLDNLIDFMKEQGHPLVIQETDNELKIEIYNDYRE